MLPSRRISPGRLLSAMAPAKRLKATPTAASPSHVPPTANHLPALSTNDSVMKSLIRPSFDPELHAENRRRWAAGMREAGASEGSILLQGGLATERHETDHEDIFRQESFFAWAFGVKEPDCLGLIDVRTGAATLLVPKLAPEYAMWMGKIRDCQSFQDEYKVDKVVYTEDVSTYAKGPCYVLSGLNTDSKRHAQIPSFPGADKLPLERSPMAYDVGSLLRSVKTEREIELMRHAQRVTCEAHAWVMKQTRAGMREFQQESLFQHFGYYFGQCRHTSYTSICGSGCNAAVLHYGHAGAANEKVILENDMCLLDMGCESRFYGSDVTCSFPASGVFSPEQRDVYQIVLDAQNAVLEAIRPGVSYVDLHELSLKTIGLGLQSIGLIKSGFSIEELMRENVPAAFMPHGLGHLLGIDTHDVGGKPPGSPVLTQPSFNRLRLVRKLEPGMVLTVEPGIYFNDYSLGEIANSPQAKYIDEQVLSRYKAAVSGIRLEDDVVVTATGCENLTRVPRTISDVEDWMSGKLTSLDQVTCPWTKKFYE